MSEDIRPVPFAPGYYVSSSGKLFSGLRFGLREMRGHVDDDGYRIVRIFGAGRPVKTSIHRLVALVFHGSPEHHSRVIRHVDGDPSNNRADNLAWGTPAENSADMVRHGRSMTGARNWRVQHPEAYPVGEAHYRAKITAGDVRAIRDVHATGTRGCHLLARDYGVSKKAVLNIIHRRSWKSVA